ncbi:alpha-2-HS-glycoprotein-like [Morone saxatilis]|uniref:alpha-2-HS-glycoprotein-like n=1 Tax=Morone saxatilis TaxID=34816 RepID=UPI0015E21DA3|nr:alpha-2-HS-glycoprotein-like [Morone saxatilis]
MNLLGITVVLVLLAGVWAQISVLRPQCDSPEAEEAALVAQDYLNGQHVHGYKYALNRIDDIKIITKPDGDNIYVLEVDLLETDCHVLDPTPVANCKVRPKVLTAVEGDCDVVLKKVGGALTVTAFKCKTEESSEDLCIGCPILLPLNDTSALDFVQASLATFNNMTVNVTYTLLEVGRMLTQFEAGGRTYLAEYVVVEANCTDDACVPLNDAMAARGICTASGFNAKHSVDCKMFSTLVPIVDANSTVAAAPALPPLVHVHTGSLSPKHGLKHHKLTTKHDPELSGLLSAESAESAEIVPVAPAVVDAAADPAAADPVAADTALAATDTAPAAADPAAADTALAATDTAPAAADTAPADDSTSASDASSSKEVFHIIFKRDVPAAPALAVANIPAIDPVPLVPVCPGRVRFF